LSLEPNNGHTVDEALLQYLSPLGWEHHINLTGDYLWHSHIIFHSLRRLHKLASSGGKFLIGQACFCLGSSQKRENKAR